VKLNYAGLILAFTTVATIAIGHELVRLLHRRFSTKPAPIFWLLSMGIFAVSAYTSNLPSGVLGIIAITFFWDGLEMYRQEKRMKHEATPNN